MSKTEHIVCLYHGSSLGSKIAPPARGGHICAESERFYFGVGKADALESLRDVALAKFAKFERELQTSREDAAKR
jgi:hypothetical protein